MTKIDLDDYPFEYGKAVASPTAKEGNRTFSLENRSGFIIRMWAIDKVVFRNRTEERCDFLFEVQSVKRKYYWVELKGGNLAKACRQILRTTDLVSVFKGSQQEARIITSGTNRIDIRSIEYLRLDKLMRKTGGRLRPFTNSRSEII